MNTGRGPPKVILENRFAVPLPFAAAWLTDFRPDDGPRWFGFSEMAVVARTPHGFHIEAPLPFGKNVNDIALDSPTHWTSSGEVVDKRGRVIHRTWLDESLADVGDGTLHRIQFWLEPQGTGAKITFALGRGAMMRSLRRGFAKMKVAMEAEYSGSSPSGNENHPLAVER